MTPLNDKKTHWGEARIENTSDSVKSDFVKQDIDDTVAWFMFKFFF